MSNSKITKRVVGAAGAAVALTAGVGLMTATPAHADVWDQVAQCESSGNWSTNTGNGFSGGLQFTQQTWNANGGSGDPSNASKSEQKRVARNVLKTQGPGAWPVCGAKAGLTRSNGGSNSGGSSDYSSNSNSESSNNYSSNNDSNGSNSNNYSSNNESSNNYSSNNQSNYSSNESGSNGSSNYTAQRSTGTYSSESTPALPKHSYKGTGEYVTIQSGDTLASIASEHNVEGGWMALWSINSSTISNPNVILAGAKIEL
ncbi:LysM peptidoglycan-binding domain-containing protein [Microlunatus soli]|uniref:LysM domain-containing protein n=1 Tax=Microlunatus soli TaxID=630515 RepID=A0A1H1STW4_9ACTN|nr:transglycosylase family protein [Microlunatus soli]SDS51375.1 LysM domain-containing protein [Microlunatus soli]